MSVRPAHWVLAAIFSTSLGVGMIFGFEPPLIAIVLNRAGRDSITIGGVIAVSLVAVTLIGPLYPILIARLGLKRSVIYGIACAVLILLAMPLWTGVTAWLTLRILTGCVLGLSWIASEIWMNTASGERARGTVMGIYGTVFSIGTASGPLLLEVTGTRGSAPFIIGAACLAGTLLPLVFVHDDARVQDDARADIDRRRAADSAGTRGLWRFAAAAPVVMLAAAVAGLVESADLSLLPLFGLRTGLRERDALWLVTVFLAGNVALQLPIGLLADRVGRRMMLGACALASAVGPLALPHAIGRPLLLWPLLFVWGGTLYAFYSQGVALLGEVFRAPRELAGANTMFVMTYCVGGVLGPSIGGYALDAWPHWGLPVLLSAAAASLPVGLIVERYRPKR